MTEYNYSWSYNEIDWQPLFWETADKTRNTFLFSTFTEDAVYVGHQVPLSYNKLERMIHTWSADPRVTVHTIGHSLGGRAIYRLEMTNPASAVAHADRWAHYITYPHPGEHNAQWRMIGMLEWLLDDKEAQSVLDRTVFHFVLLMSPDGPAHGWYRVNAQGIDMNRSYCLPESDAAQQPHEAHVCQQDLEQLMQCEPHITSVWNMHTWPGIVEPIVYPGPEFASSLGDWTMLRDALEQYNEQQYVKPLRLADVPQGIPEGWNGGPQRQFGITGVLCEGGGALVTKEANKAAGRVLIRGIAAYYAGTAARVRVTG
jgi:hypothetical protein